MLSYTIQAAQQSGLFTDIVVSTDSIKTAQIAEEYGASAQLRPVRLSDDKTPIIEVVRYVAKQYDDDVVLLYATAPLMDGQIIRDAYKVFKENKRPLLAVDDAGRDAGMFCFYHRTNIVSEDFRFFHVRGGIDINTPDDWERVYVMFANMKGKLQ